MTKITVTAFIFHDDRLLLVFHKKLQRWMHVGGHVEENELFDEALKREIKEEVGLNVEIIDAHSLGISYNRKLATPIFVQGNEKSGKKDISIDYVCKVIGTSSVRLQSEELEDYKWVSMPELESINTFPLLKQLAKEAFKMYRFSQKM
ncbi:TPA: NUDIX hydrolase [Candidatus Woesearchaeota archaeon]|nr:NUDIX hydrolase [Candidatus Woesearchaeota archaeon]HIH32523.1 NUDIX hydrolase [Candidatus Woesearchaeota archaeon]HIH55101.1 NUDIX hydrolase [Candidatus Woesearchaeota archaeon]HIJ01706.1 NUDIX hydrolase [Candidatus Woesearchaeota archaeon]HIJ13254.1 NUDIX hydrolase [Candidatus Woesearchaeota archaeon]